MATPISIEAKRRHEKYSALKHGLAVNAILPHEDPAEYHQIRAALIETWQPANAQELMEVDNIAMGWWCMQRSNRFEARMFALQVQTMKRLHEKATAPHADDDGGIVASFCDRNNDKSYELLFRYDSRAASKYYRALDHLMKLQSFRARLQRTQAKAVTSELASFGAPAPQPLPTPPQRGPVVFAPASQQPSAGPQPAHSVEANIVRPDEGTVPQ